MIQSMTGYGSTEAAVPGGAVRVELRAVNAKYLDARLRLPREYATLEPAVLAAVRDRLQRGRVEVRVERHAAGAQALVPDLECARAHLALRRELAADLGLPEEVSLEAIVRAEGVVRPAITTDDLETIQPALQGALAAALDQLVEMRVTEGARLLASLEQELACITEQLDAIVAEAEPAVAAHHQRLTERITALCAEPVEPTRLAQELALTAERADFREETERLASHRTKFRELLAADEPVGRRLDFLAQEMYREANTLGSKATETAIAHRAVEIKAAIERLREQVQNIL